MKYVYAMKFFSEQQLSCNNIIIVCALPEGKKDALCHKFGRFTIGSMIFPNENEIYEIFCAR